MELIQFVQDPTLLLGSSAGTLIIDKGLRGWDIANGFNSTHINYMKDSATYPYFSSESNTWPQEWTNNNGNIIIPELRVKSTSRSGIVPSYDIIRREGFLDILPRLIDNQGGVRNRVGYSSLLSESAAKQLRTDIISGLPGILTQFENKTYPTAALGPGTNGDPAGGGNYQYNETWNWVGYYSSDASGSYLAYWLGAKDAFDFSNF